MSITEIPQQTAEHSIQAGDSFSIFLNQAERDGEVLAIIGDEFLGAYRMPMGRLFLITQKVDADSKDCATYRSLSLAALPKKWQAAIREQGGVFTLDDALDNMGYNLETIRGRVTTSQAERRQWARDNRIPQWVRDLNANPA